jgi:diadenosine tetraphosphatase ApaH/serine/threonine PP2A family protein phosphatase
MSQWVALISDVHGNLEAFRSVLHEVDRLGIDTIYSLGDVVGYGPEPVECLKLARERCRLLLKGNHELEMVRPGGSFMNPRAQRAADWTRDQLRAAGQLDVLATLPVYHKLGDSMLIHGSVCHPLLDYVSELDGHGFSRVDEIADSIEQEFEDFDVCFVGHNHRPFLTTIDGFIFPHDEWSEFQIAGERLYVSVGSVGQPRDGDPRSCFVTYDGSTVRFHRVSYEIEKTVARIKGTPLPASSAERLMEGT